MLHEARDRARAGCDLARVEFVHARLPPPAEPFDAVVTNFFLDCFRPPSFAAINARLASVFAAPDARWLLADSPS